MSVEYAPKGLIGVLTPQANTTVEPEYTILTPPGYAFVNARLLSPRKTIEERLLDYFANIRTFAGQFANAPIDVLAFACTGTSYLVGMDSEDKVLNDLSLTFDVPVISAATAAVMALDVLGAKHIALVSPYEGQLDAACRPYWESRGYSVAAKTSAAGPRGDSFHPIYSLSSGAALQALAAITDDNLDAVLMLGTGMPTLAAIARSPFHRGAPVLSCMFCLIWAGIVLAGGNEPTREGLKEWLFDPHWRERMGLQ